MVVLQLNMSPPNYQRPKTNDNIHRGHNSYLWYCYTNYVNGAVFTLYAREAAALVLLCCCW